MNQVKMGQNNDLKRNYLIKFRLESLYLEEKKMKGDFFYIFFKTPLNHSIKKFYLCNSKKS